MDYGIQLYSVRDYEDDFDYCFSRLNEFKYKFVEFAGFNGNSPERINELLKKWDLSVIGAHVSLDSIINDFAGTVKFHQAIGNDKIIIPSHHVHKKEKVEELVNAINKYQPMFEKEGLQLLFHNHENEFIPNNDGQIAFDILKAETDVLFEIDTFWVFYAGQDPIKVVKDNIDRVKLVHIKDGLLDRREGRPLGEGKAPVKDCVNMALELGLPMVVESEEMIPDGISEAKKCYKFLRKMSEEMGGANG